MADKGVGHISTSIFPDEIKSALSGNLTFDVAINAEGVHKWVYCTKAITSTAAIFTTANDYFDGVAVADTDIAKYIAIKHSGTSDGSNTTSAGLMLSINGEAAAYNDDDGIFLEPGEMIVLKCPWIEVQNIRAIAVTITNGKPSAAAGTVQIIAAAILDDH